MSNGSTEAPPSTAPNTPPKTNQHLRLWAGLSFVAALALTFLEAFGVATPDHAVIAALLGAGLGGLGLVQGRNIAELYGKQTP